MIYHLVDKTKIVKTKFMFDISQTEFEIYDQDKEIFLLKAYRIDMDLYVDIIDRKYLYGEFFDNSFTNIYINESDILNHSSRVKKFIRIMCVDDTKYKDSYYKLNLYKH
jgi:hypothetical protein